MPRSPSGASARRSPRVLIKSLERNALHTSQIRDMVRLNGNRSNGVGRPFGDDFINYWSGAFLALHGRAAEVYSFNGFHAFERGVAGAPIDFYHYSYPPVLLALTAPLAIIPYV